MPRKKSSQRSATRKGGTCSPWEAPTRRDYSPAKRRNDPRTGDPTPKPPRIAGSPSKACGSTKEPPKPVEQFPMSATTCGNDMPESTAVVVRELRPKQVLAATLLVQGQQGRQVAKALNVTEETVSRWRHRPEFQALMRELLREHVASVQLGMIALTGEAIGQLHNLVHAFSDTVSLKACALVLGKAAPIIGVIGEELRRSPDLDHR